MARWSDKNHGPLTVAQRKLVDDSIDNLHQAIWGDLRYLARLYDSMEDAYQAAMLGVCRAAQVFDSSRGVRFWTVGWLWARAVLQNGLRRRSVMAVPDSVLSNRGDAICDDDYSFIETVADASLSEPIVDSIRSDNARVCREMLETLPDDHRSLLEMEFGIGDGWEYSIQQIAGVVGINRNSVYAKRDRILSRLNKRMKRFAHCAA